MPFEEVSGVRVSGVDKGTPDNVMVSTTPNAGAVGKFSLVFRFGHRVLDRLGWEVGKHRLALLEGNGREAGLVKILIAPSTAKSSWALCAHGASKQGTGSFRISPVILRWHDAPAETQPASEVEFQAFGGEMLLMLPDWMPRRSEPKKPGEGA